MEGSTVVASGPSLDIRSLKVFLTVGAKGNMTVAARTLGMTQSSVSQVIQRLERTMGAPLFDRMRRPLRLTAAGSILSRRVERLVEEAELLSAAVREASSVSEIRVGLVDSVAGTVGPHLIRTFMDRVSTITLWAGLTLPLVQALMSRQVDVVIAADLMDDLDSFRHIQIASEPFILALPKSYPVPHGPLTLEGLARGLALIRYSARSSIGIRIDRHLRRCSVSAPRRLEIDSSDTLFAMVAAGVGWALTTPLCVLHGRPDPSAVRLLPLPGPGFARQIVMIARHGEYQDLVDRLASDAREALRSICLPAIRRSMPWIADEIVL